ncbi:ectonucleoside triphosphate diphosphohydrolase 4 isoform X1 [Erpetoichthys calabaricus]|uniref:ectonucleoside triphosphate diphosphohydrolase 4 isoform X1 n=1 Tax=Erpetoichthys calabaricus TaxID=27687 RepID=UPI0022349065|nr:ectonucleoside triphosphate diphosphohydrolase 4 isoform X1 [Erpetoichthys calabaricus]
MGRINFSCLLPASWHFSLAPVGVPRIVGLALRQLLLLGICLGMILLLYFILVMTRSKHSWLFKDKQFQRYLARVTDMEATDTSNPNLNYGIVVDCGSSGSRIFVYCWPRHNGNPHDLLDIKQMRDKNRKPVVMKIKPGISDLATTPEKASDYIYPLLSFAENHIPKGKHKETPLYILCTAGMRILPESQQEALLEDLRTDIPVHFDFLFSDSHVEVISGKQEGVYAWIGINFVLGRFDHIEEDDDAIVEVHIPGSENQEALIRKRTAGILDMGGVSTQIAYEVPKTVSFASLQQEEVAKNLLAEFNLGCDAHQTEHVYRVYVTTFLGFGGNAARQRYEESLFNKAAVENGLLGKHIGETSESPYLDPCLPLDIEDEIQNGGKSLYLRGTGDFDLCRVVIQPFMNKTNETHSSLNGVYQPLIEYTNSEFYGFSEFYYCTEDVLRMGGDYDATKYSNAAKSYCATKWTTLKERFDRGLYASHADLHRLKYQCFKSAWMYEVFHVGFSFPENYKGLKTAQLVYDKEVQWTLGAILYRTRFLPLRDIQQENFKGSHSHWRGFSFVYNHYLFLVCFLVVLLSILLYLLRLRRIHRRMQRNLSSSALWMEEGVATGIGTGTI